MFLKSASMGKLLLMGLMAAQFTACNEAEFFEKEYLTTNVTNDDDSQSSTSNCTTNCAGSGSTDLDLQPGSGDNSEGSLGIDSSTDSSGSSTDSSGSTDVTDGGNSTDSGGSTGGTDTTSPNYQDMTDSFVQNASEKGALDILWVVDNSGSMGDEQASLAYNFDVFIRDFVTKDVDFQMAITTTDATNGREGAAVGDFSLLNSTAAKADSTAFVDYFAQQVMVGTSGSGIEKGLNGMSKFLAGDGASWLRKDAFLAVVVISDEEDQSSEAVSSYVNYLKSLKTNDRFVSVHSIITFQNDQWGDPSRGQRYMDTSNATGGVIADIKNDFHNILMDMGGTILDLIHSFPLSSTPVANSIKVFVDGAEKTTGWTYDSSKNAINFVDGNVPSENAHIEVKYKSEV